MLALFMVFIEYRTRKRIERIQKEAHRAGWEAAVRAIAATMEMEVEEEEP
jgi:hypothetical protein